jgi:hypothetical protein
LHAERPEGACGCTGLSGRTAAVRTRRPATASLAGRPATEEGVEWWRVFEGMSDGQGSVRRDTGIECF